MPGGRYRVSAAQSGAETAGVMAQWTKAGNWYGGSWPAPIPALPANATTKGWRTLGQEVPPCPPPTPKHTHTSGHLPPTVFADHALASASAAANVKRAHRFGAATAIRCHPKHPRADPLARSGAALRRVFQFVVPPDADPGSVYVSVLNGYEVTKHTDAVWANVSLVLIPPLPLRTTLVSPGYRGRVTKHSPDRVVVRAWTSLPAVPALEAVLQGADGSELASVRVENPPTNVPVDLAFASPPQAMLPAAGAYTVVVRCVDRPSKGNATLAEASHRITRIADTAPDPKVWIDGRQRLLADGEPFFPLGLYYQEWAADGMNETASEPPDTELIAPSISCDSLSVPNTSNETILGSLLIGRPCRWWASRRST